MNIISGIPIGPIGCRPPVTAFRTHDSTHHFSAPFQWRGQRRLTHGFPWTKNRNGQSAHSRMPMRGVAADFESRVAPPGSRTTRLPRVTSAPFERA